MTDTPELLINPVVRWAVHPADQGRIAYVPGMPADTLPRENELITRPFLVDPASRCPMPVRVVLIRKTWDSKARRHILEVEVARDH